MVKQSGGNFKNLTWMPYEKHAPLDSDLAYSANLRRGSSRCYFSCRAWYDQDSGQDPRIPVFLDPVIRKPALDLKLRWYNNTGDKALEGELRDMVIREARKF